MSFWTFIAGVPSQSTQDAQLAAGQTRYNAALANRVTIDQAAQANGGIYDPATNGYFLLDGSWAPAISADTAAADLQYGSTISDNNIDAGAYAEFQAGAAQGLHNVLAAPGALVGAVGSGAGSILGGILKNIPWWVWLVGAGALFVWMGGAELLAGLLKGRLTRK